MKNWQKQLISILFLGLISCATVPDAQVCVRLDEGFGAACTTTLTDDRTIYTEEEYKEMETGLYVMKPEEWSKIKEFILKTCEKSSNCKLNKTEERIEGFENYGFEMLKFTSR